MGVQIEILISILGSFLAAFLVSLLGVLFRWNWKNPRVMVYNFQTKTTSKIRIRTSVIELMEISHIVDRSQSMIDVKKILNTKKNVKNGKEQQIYESLKDAKIIMFQLSLIADAFNQVDRRSYYVVKFPQRFYVEHTNSPFLSWRSINNRRRSARYIRRQIKLAQEK